MRQHGTLGGPGGPRGVDEDGHRVGVDGVDQVVDAGGVGVELLPPHRHELVPRHQDRVVVVADAPRLHVHHLDEMGEPVPDLHHFVDLLLVLGDEHPGLGVAHEVLHLGRRVRGIQSHRRGLDRLGAEIGDHPRPAVLGVDGHLVARPDAEAAEGHAGDLRLLPVVGIACLLPDPELLLAQPHLVGMGRGDVAQPGGEAADRDVRRSGCGAFVEGGHGQFPPVAASAVSSWSARSSWSSSPR
jgi:hypothetical protein